MRRKYVHRPPAPINTYAIEEEPDAVELGAERPWRMRFGIRELLMLMAISSVVFAGLGYLVHALRGGGRGFHLAFVLFTLIGPMALLALFSIVSWLIRHRPSAVEDTDATTGER